MKKQRDEKTMKRLSSNFSPTPKRSQGSRFDIPQPSTSRATRTPRSSQTSEKKGFDKQLEEFRSLRKSETTSREFTSVPSQELIWIRDDTGTQKLDPINIPSTSKAPIPIDYEIEEGEIVEREVTEIIDLLEESLSVVNQSKLVTDINQVDDLFFEDRKASSFGQVPKYNTYESVTEPPTDLNGTVEEDDVICLDNSQPDDSVIFVSEEKTNLNVGKDLPLKKPDFLKSNAVKKLLKLLPTSPDQKTRRRECQRTRFKLWKKKKQAEHALLLNGGKKNGVDVNTKPKASTSTEAITAPPEEKKVKVDEKIKVKPKLPEKRIVLIDGSNLAMAFTENYGSKKTEKDFSAEGKKVQVFYPILNSLFFSGLKICIEHFESQGFQVKAIVPEFRVRRDKSSNHTLMNELKETGKLLLTPSKSYDDRVLLEAAARLDAAVVSNDHYRESNCAILSAISKYFIFFHRRFNSRETRVP